MPAKLSRRKPKIVTKTLTVRSVSVKAKTGEPTFIRLVGIQMTSSDQPQLGVYSAETHPCTTTRR